MRVGREEGSSLPSPLGRRAWDEGWERGRVEPPFSSREKGGDEGSCGEGNILAKEADLMPLDNDKEDDHGRDLS